MARNHMGGAHRFMRNVTSAVLLEELFWLRDRGRTNVIWLASPDGDFISGGCVMHWIFVRKVWEDGDRFGNYLYKDWQDYGLQVLHIMLYFCVFCSQRVKVT